MPDWTEINKTIEEIGANRFAPSALRKTKFTWFQKWRFRMVMQWIERQIVRAKWSWPTTVCGIFGGLALILPEMAKLLDGDAKTSPDMEKLAAGFGIMGLGWTAKSAGNTGVAPLPKGQA